MPKSTAVSKMSPTAVALAAAIEKTSKDIKQQSGDMPYLRLLKSGEWVYGADDVDVEKGSLWAVDPASFARGFQAWGNDADLLGEEIALVTDVPVLKSDLADVGGDWKPLMGCILVCISGDDEGLMVSYKTTSNGGIKAIGRLMDELVSRIKSAPADGTYIPVIELEKGSYKHKKYGKIYTPDFDIKEWTDEDELMSADEDDDEMGLGTEPEPEPEPKKEAPKKRTRKSKKVVEPEPEEEEDEDEAEEEAEPEPDPKPSPRKRRRRVV